MQRALAAAHLAAHAAQALQQCRRCGHALHALFCTRCRRSFCRCRLAAHARCDVARDAQLARVQHALQSIYNWMRNAQPNQVPRCTLRLRVRAPSATATTTTKTVWLTLRVRAPLRRSETRRNCALSGPNENRTTQSIASGVSPNCSGQTTHRKLAPSQLQTAQPDLAAQVEPQHSPNCSSRDASPTRECNARANNKRVRPGAKDLHHHRIASPVNKRRRMRHTAVAAPTTKVVKTCTRLKVSQTAPQLAPKAKVAPVFVQQPFATSSLHTKHNTNASLDHNCDALNAAHSQVDAAKCSTNKSQSLCNTHEDQHSIRNTLPTNQPTPINERMQERHNADVAEDKLSEGTTNPCGREDGYEDDPITPMRDPLHRKALTTENRPPVTDTIGEHSISFISPLTTEKQKQPLSTQCAAQADDNKPLYKPQLHTTSGTFTVCISDFSDDEQHELVFEIITHMGGEPLQRIRKSRPNCVITPLHAETGAIKSQNMSIALALALRVPIVGMQWLIHSFKAGRWMAPDSYDASAALHRKSVGVFNGLIATMDELFLAPGVCESVAELREDVKRLIIGADGVVVDATQLAERVGGDSRATLHVHVVKDLEDERCETVQSVGCMQDKIATKVVNTKWLCRCVLSGQCPPAAES